MENKTEIKKSIKVSDITVSRVYTSDFQKTDTLTAELKQVVETTSRYPKKRISNDKQDNIFNEEDFGIDTEEFLSKETRVAWLLVPMDSTIESVQTVVDNNPNANLYRILSNKPILTDAQKYSIETEQSDLSSYANKQVVRIPETARENPGMLAKDTNGKIQYRKVFFSSKGTEDIDARTEVPADFYASEELRAEIEDFAAVSDEQTV